MDEGGTERCEGWEEWVSLTPPRGVMSAGGRKQSPAVLLPFLDDSRACEQPERSVVPGADRLGGGVSSY